MRIIVAPARFEGLIQGVLDRSRSQTNVSIVLLLLEADIDIMHMTRGCSCQVVNWLFVSIEELKILMYESIGGGAIPASVVYLLIPFLRLLAPLNASESDKASQEEPVQKGCF